MTNWPAISPWTIRVADWQRDGAILRAIREQVFIHEQSVPVELEWDEHDENCLHLLAINTRRDAIGTARLVSGSHIGRMAVLKAWRGQGAGSALMRHLLDQVRKNKKSQAILNAQIHAAPFYTTLGFTPSGKEFMDAGIPHVTMVCRL